MKAHNNVTRWCSNLLISKGLRKVLSADVNDNENITKYTVVTIVALKLQLTIPIYYNTPLDRNSVIPFPFQDPLKLFAMFLLCSHWPMFTNSLDSKT